MSVRRDPFEAMERMFDQMRRSTRPVWDDAIAAVDDGTINANVTVEQDEDAYVVLADLPGFEREEIDLTYADGVLVITGTHETGDDEHYRSRHVEERVSVPGTVDEDHVEATYRNGVLEVRLPFVEGGDETHHIEIE